MSIAQGTSVVLRNTKDHTKEGKHAVVIGPVHSTKNNGGWLKVRLIEGGSVMKARITECKPYKPHSKSAQRSVSAPASSKNLFTTSRKF